MLGLLTGNIRLGAEIKLRHFNLWDAFQTGAFADDHEERDQIAAVARQRGSRILGTELRGDEVVVIGDTPLDIRCARAIGAKALAVATGGAKLAELETAPARLGDTGFAGDHRPGSGRLRQLSGGVSRRSRSRRRDPLPSHDRRALDWLPPTGRGKNG